MNTKIICNIHKQIEDLAERLKNIKSYHYSEINIFVDEVNQIGNDILKLLNEATIAGQHMEKRLKEYRETIERLGFKRNKNNILDYQIKHLKDKIAELGIELNNLKKK